MSDEPDILAIATRMIAEVQEEMTAWCMSYCNETWEDEVRVLRVMGWKYRKRKKKECGLEGVPYRQIRDLAAEKRKKAQEFPELPSLLDLEPKCSANA